MAEVLRKLIASYAELYGDTFRGRGLGCLPLDTFCMTLPSCVVRDLTKSIESQTNMPTPSPRWPFVTFQRSWNNVMS